MKKYLSVVLFTALMLALQASLPGVRKEKQPPYKDAALPVEVRVKDLLNRMTVEEKVGQLTCMLGWEMVERQGDGVVVAEQFRQAVEKKRVGMLWATLRADPWTQRTLATGLTPCLSAQATNALQRYVMENTRLGIPLFIAEECPHGHMAIGTTVFPTSIGQASTWNPALVREMAATIAREARMQGAHVGYGPVLDLARDPRWSRTEETYGEDPVLVAAMGEAMVSGFQGDSPNAAPRLISTLKHFAAYGVPEGGHNGGPAHVGRRELMQTYLYPFECAVRAGARSVMSSYNSVDGVPCTSNPFLLKEILRERWGFTGFTVSDLGSIEGLCGSHRVASDRTEASLLALKAGLDVDLGGNAYSRGLLEASREGRLEMAVLDRAVEAVLRLKFEMGLFEQPYVEPEKAQREVRSEVAVTLARQVAREGVILLKNDNNLLPLKKEIRNICVVGPNADNIYNQLGDYTAPQPRANIKTVLDGIRGAVSPATQVTYVKGCDIRDTTHAEIEKAVAAARQSEVVVMVLGGSSARDFETEYLETGAATLPEQQRSRVSDMESGEGFDRSSLDLMGRQLQLLQEVIKTGRPVVLVLIQGRPLNINWAAGHVPAILNAWYPGQEGGAAIADVLFGDYNPAGRLPISIPRSVGQLPVYYNYLRPHRHNYIEESAAPLYPFGYGLSYTQFSYSNLEVEKMPEGVVVSFELSNVGECDGDEVVQLYLRHDVAPVATPVKQLRRFQRIHLKKGECRKVVFTLTEGDFRIYDQDLNPITADQHYTILLGSSSEEIRLQYTQPTLTQPPLRK